MFAHLFTLPFVVLSVPVTADVSDLAVGDLQCLLQQSWSVTTVSSVDADGAAQKEDIAEPDSWDFGALLQVQKSVQRAQRMQAPSEFPNATAGFDVPASLMKQNATVVNADVSDVIALETVTAKTSKREASANLTALVALQADLAAPESSATSNRTGIMAAATLVEIHNTNDTNAEDVAVLGAAAAERGAAQAFANRTAFMTIHADRTPPQSSETPGITPAGSNSTPMKGRSATVTDAEAVIVLEVATAEAGTAQNHATSERSMMTDLVEGQLGQANTSMLGDGEEASALLQKTMSVERTLPPVTLPASPPRPAEAFFLLLFLAYPILFLLSAVGGAAVLGTSLTREGELSRGRGGPPRVPPSRLAPFSRRIYSAWSFFCAFIPAQLVIGTPFIFVVLRWQWPQGTLSAFLALAAVWTLSNVAHLAVFGGLSLARIRRCMVNSFVQPSKGESAEESNKVTHWVLLPNHQEDLSKLTATVESVCRSVVAGAHIGLVLAMEEREAATIFGKAKAEQLRDRYASKFQEFHLCLRPASVQSASPGTASNLSWAFDWLLEHLACTNQDTSRALLTVTSPGDELHELYFQQLAEAYIAETAEMRALTLWQSPVVRLRDYHKRPAPVAVASALDTVSSLVVAQPNSSYSLSLSLARRVGGWDPDVAKEDAHMGVKCFLLTLGLARVRPLGLPTLRAALGGLGAFWVERRQQALGCGDAASYYFATLPLVLAHILAAPEGVSFSDFVRVWFGGIPYLAQLMNEHVFPGALAAVVLAELFSPKAYLADQLQMAGGASGQIFAGICLFGLLAFVACTSACLSVTYGELRKRLWEAECLAGGDARKEMSWDGLHAFAFTRWVYCCARMFALGVCCFVAIVAAAWAAATETAGGHAWEQRSLRGKQRPPRSPAAELHAASQELLAAAPGVRAQL